MFSALAPGMTTLATMMTAVDQHNEETGTMWEQTWHIITSPPHAIAEIVWSIIFDVVIWGLFLIFAKITQQKMFERFHRKLDKEHGIKHAGDDLSGAVVSETECRNGAEGITQVDKKTQTGNTGGCCCHCSGH